MGVQPFLWILRKTERSYPDRRELQPITGGAFRVNLNRPQFSHGDFTDDAFWGETATTTNRAERVRGLTEVRLWVRAFLAATIRNRPEDFHRLVARPSSSTPTRVTTLRTISRQ